MKHLLDPEVREAMVAEFELDISNGRLYLSSYQTATGHQAWPKLLKEALAHHDIDWLVSNLGDRAYWNNTYQRRKPTGGFTNAKVPITAPSTLASGEFQRFYARAVSVVAAERGKELIVVRVREVSHPRPESEAKIGMRVEPARLLQDLRENIGIDTFLGVPAGPNSGLGVEIAE